MIRKAPLAETQIALGKQKNTFCGTPVYYFPNKFSIWRQCASLNFKMFILRHLAVIEFQMCCCVPNLIKIGWFFVEIIMAILRFAIRRLSVILNFRKLRVYVMWPPSLCCSASICKIWLKSDNRLLIYGQKRILPRDAMHKRGLCCHAVSVRPSVRQVRGSRQNDETYLRNFFTIG